MHATQPIYTVSSLTGNWDLLAKLAYCEEGSMSLVKLDTGEVVEMPTVLMIVNSFFWQAWRRIGQKIDTNKIYITDVVDKNFGVDVHTEIYLEAMLTRGSNGEFIEKGHRQDRALSIICFNISAMQNFCMEHLDEWAVPLSLENLLDLFHSPPIQKLREDIPKENEEIKNVAPRLKELEHQLMDHLESDDFEFDNRLRDLALTKSLKPGQLRQTFLAFGSRSDIDLGILRHNIQQCTLTGTRSVEDYATESTSGKRAMWNNFTAVSTSQYFGRLIHLLMCDIEKLADGDCGNRQFHEFKINANNWSKLEGMRYIDDAGESQVLTAEEAKSRIGTTINKLALPCCQFAAEGGCEHCNGGQAIFMYHRHRKGLVHGCEVVVEFTQTTLSTKHDASVRTVDYAITADVRKYFQYSKKEFLIFKKEWHPIFEEENYVVFPKSIGDLATITNKEEMAEIFSGIVTSVGFTNAEKQLVGNVNLAADRIVFSLSKEFTAHIASVGFVEEPDAYWIPLKGFNPKHPFVQHQIIADEVAGFVGQVKKFINGQIAEYDNLPDALQAFTDLVYTRSSANILHVEQLLYSLLVPEDSYKRTRLEDPAKARFAKRQVIMCNRSASQKLAEEKLAQHYRKATTFIQPAETGMFDPFAGFEL